jgi:hypothetical protein
VAGIANPSAPFEDGVNQSPFNRRENGKPQKFEVFNRRKGPDEKNEITRYERCKSAPELPCPTVAPAPPPVPPEGISKSEQRPTEESNPSQVKMRTRGRPSRIKNRHSDDNEAYQHINSKIANQNGERTLLATARLVRAYGGPRSILLEAKP